MLLRRASSNGHNQYVLGSNHPKVQQANHHILPGQRALHSAEDALIRWSVHWLGWSHLCRPPRIHAILSIFARRTESGYAHTRIDHQVQKFQDKRAVDNQEPGIENQNEEEQALSGHQLPHPLHLPVRYNRHIRGLLSILHENRMRILRQLLRTLLPSHLQHHSLDHARCHYIHFCQDAQ